MGDPLARSVSTQNSVAVVVGGAPLLYSGRANVLGTVVGAPDQVDFHQFQLCSPDSIYPGSLVLKS